MNEKKMDKQAFQQMMNIITTNPMWNFKNIKFSWHNQHPNPCVIGGEQVTASFDEFVDAVSRHDKALAQKLQNVIKAQEEFLEHVHERMR